MNKVKGSAVGNGAGNALQLVGRTILGGLCGVGALWTLTALWPPSHRIIHHFGQEVQAFSRDYPVVLLGLLLGMGGTLLWQAVRK